MHTRVIVLMVSLLGGGPTITVAGQPRGQGGVPLGQGVPLVCISHFPQRDTVPPLSLCPAGGLGERGDRRW